MYCSNCGKTLSTNLNYCNNCGTRVENKPVVVRDGAPVLAIAGAFTGAIGLIAFYPILRELIRSPLETGAVVVIIAAYLLTVFSMFGVLVWQSRRHSTTSRHTGSRSSEDFVGYQRPLRGVSTAQLHEPNETPASVTEHTTRTLDAVPSRRD